MAVAVYLGAAAFANFLSLQQAPPDILDEYPELLLEIPQLQVSFEDRDELEDWERQLLRNLNLKFHGWEDRYERISPPPLTQVPLTWDSRHIKKLKHSASRGDIIELDFFMYPGSIAIAVDALDVFGVGVKFQEVGFVHFRHLPCSSCGAEAAERNG